MKILLAILLSISIVGPNYSWAGDRGNFCEKDDTSASYEKRMRWWIVTGGEAADFCKRSRSIYKRLSESLVDIWKQYGSEIDEAMIADFTIHVGSLARPPKVAVDVSELDTQTMLLSDNWKQGAGSTQEKIILAFPRGCRAVKVGDNANCDADFIRLLDGLSLSLFMQEFATQIDKHIMQEELLRSSKRLAQWKAYLNDEQFQYPWELGLNFCWKVPNWKNYDSTFGRSQCFVPGWNVVKGRKVQDSSAPIGWEKSPSFRFIYLHPELAVSYSSEPRDGDKVNAALVFEWIGAYWWSWNEDWKKNGDDVFNCSFDVCPFGFSLASALVDLPDNDALGFGVSTHVHNFMISATRHEGKHGENSAWVFSVSLNLSKLLESDNGRTSKYLRELFLK